MRIAAIFVLVLLASLARLHAQTANPSTGCFPLDVSFTPPDNGTAFWDFGDGVTSSLTNPNHVYTRAGVFTVTVRRNMGGPVLGTTTVTVYPKPQLQLTVDTAKGCVPHPVRFGASANVNPAIQIQNYTWAFGDGGSGSGQNPSYVYNDDGLFDVTIRITTNLSTCNVTQVFEDAVEAYALPEVNFSTDPSPAQSCETPLTVRVNDLSTGAGPLTYAWNFGNGRTSTSKTPGSTVYASAGTYQISLRVTDINGCVGSDIERVSVGGPDPNFDLPDTVCYNVPYLVRPLGAADTYRYTFGPNITVIEDFGANQFIIFRAAGPTTVGLAVTNAVGNCSSDTTRTIFVQRVFVDAVADPLYSCESEFDVRLRVLNPAGEADWFIKDGPNQVFNSRDTTIRIIYDQGGEYGQNWYEFAEALVAVTSPQGCVGDTLLTIATDKPNALFFPDKHYGCAPLTVVFADSVRSTQNVTSYLIEWGDGTQQTFTTPGPWPHTYTTPGEYRAFISVTNSAGCTDRSFGIDIQVGAPIGGLNFTIDGTSTCPGDSLTFVNLTDDARIDNIKFSVEGGNDFHCGDQDSLSFLITQPITGTTLDATLYVEYNGCLDSLTRTLPYTPAALADLGYRIDCETPFDITFFNRSTGSTVDSLLVFGITDTAFRQNLLFGPTDSLRLTLPTRGVYRAIVQAVGPNRACAPTRDTVEFYITLPEAVFTIPDQFCSGLPLPLDGSGSQDVNADCHKGYQWDFTWDRPYVTSDPTLTDSEITATGRGPQTVTLIVSDINGCVDSLSQPIRLFANIPTISADKQRICLPSTVVFNATIDTDTTVVEYMWDFGGIGTSTQRNPTFTFPAGAASDTIIRVTLTTKDALDCPGMDTFNLQIYRPISRVTTQPSPPFICAGDAVRFEASDFTASGSNLRFNWNFGNGQTSQNRIENIVYPTEGTFNAVLRYTEASSGCAGDTTIQVVVEVPPVPAFTSSIDGQAVVCYPAIVTFTDATTSSVPTTAIWSVNGIVAEGPTFTATLGRGINVVTLTSVTNRSGCVATVSRTFNLAGPGGDFAFTPQTICTGQTVQFSLQDTVDVQSWTWDFGNGVTQDNTNPATATYDFRPASGFTVVSLTLRAQSSECTFTAVDTLRFNDVLANFTTNLASDVTCDAEVQFIDQSVGAGVYLYTFPGGSTSPDRNPRFTFPGPGTYSVTLAVQTADGVCRADTTKSITILPDLAPVVTIIPACPGEAATFTVTAARPLSVIDITPRNIIASQNGNVFTTIPLIANQTFSVMVTDTFGCDGTVSNLNIGVAEVFEGQGDTVVIFAGTSVTLTVPNAEGYTLRWQNPDLVGCADCNNPTVMPAVTTDYLVTVSDAGACNTTNIVFRVIVAEEPVVPNLFSPNGDGNNDTWGPLFPEGLQPTVETYQVYSRWGSLVFDSDVATEKWVGDNRGNGDAPSDVYTYVVKLTYGNGSSFSSSGEVTLLR